MSDLGKMPEGRASAQGPRAPPFVPGLDGSFRCPPAMGNEGNVPKDLSVPHGSQNPALDPKSHKITGPHDLPAGGDSYQPYPMQDLLLSQGAMWLQRYHNNLTELQAGFYLRLRKRESEWYERYDKKNIEIIEKSVEIATLIVGSSPQFFCYF